MNAQRQYHEQNLFSLGIKILNRDIPILIKWLAQVRSATVPENSAIASSQALFLSQENALQIWRITSLGQLGDARKKLPKNLILEDNKENQFNILYNLIRSIQPIFIRNESHKNPNSPIYAIISQQEIGWAMTGIPLISIPIRYLKLLEILRFYHLIESTPGVSNKRILYAPSTPLTPIKLWPDIQSLYERASARLAEQRSNILHVDPADLFGDAEDENFSELENVNGVSPSAAINNILNYLRHGNFGIGSPPCHARNITYEDNFGNVYAETQEILCQIREQINDVSTKYDDRLKIIFGVARLSDGEVFLNNRLQNIIRRTLTNFIKSEEGKATPLRHKLLLANEITKELERYGNSNLTEVRFDLANALSITKNTLQNFAQIFDKSIGKTLNKVHAQAQSREGPFAKRLLNKYCALLLSIPNWGEISKNKIDITKCYGLGLMSEWHNQDQLFESGFSQQQYYAPFNQERACHFRRFLRREKFYQSYGKPLEH